MNIKWRPILSVFEKSLAQWIQSFVLLMLGTTIFEQWDFSLVQGATLATLPTGFTVLANSLASVNIPVDLPYFVQVVLRTFRSGAAAFLGFLIAAIPLEMMANAVDGRITLTTDMLIDGLGTSALAAAGVAILAAIKAELGKYFGNPNTVGWLPRSVETLPDDGSLEYEDYDPNDPDLIGDPVEPGEVPNLGSGEETPPPLPPV